MLYLLDVNQSERLAIIKVCCSFLASSKVLIDLTCQVVRKCHQFKTGDSLGNWIVEHERPNFVTDCIPVSTKLRPLMKLANSIPGFYINLENIFSGIISMKTVSMLWTHFQLKSSSLVGDSRLEIGFSSQSYNLQFEFWWSFYTEGKITRHTRNFLPRTGEHCLTSTLERLRRLKENILTDLSMGWRMETAAGQGRPGARLQVRKAAL